MPKQEGQKTKLLALLHIFEQKTDENHLLNVPQLVELLEQQGILAERKSIYSDIDTLCALGYDIQKAHPQAGSPVLRVRGHPAAASGVCRRPPQGRQPHPAVQHRRAAHGHQRRAAGAVPLQEQQHLDGQPLAAGLGGRLLLPHRLPG